MRKINKSFFIAWSIIAVLVFANVAVAATTIGTNITTTSSGTLTVDGLSIFTGGASVSKNFEVSGDYKLGVNAGTLIDTSLEVGGTASISGATTLGSTLTVTGNSTFTGSASVSKNFEIVGDKRLGINAGGATETSLEVGGTASISGATTLGSTLTVTGLSVFNGRASVSTNFEVGSTASASSLIVGTVASASTTLYTAQFNGPGTTASTSVLFGSAAGSARGTCLQLKDDKGVTVYCRILNSSQATFTCNTTKCHD